MLGGMALVIALAAVVVPSGLFTHAAHAAATSSTVTYTGKAGTVTKTSSASSLHTLKTVVEAGTNTHIPKILTALRGPKGPSKSSYSAAASASTRIHGAPKVSASSMAQQGSLLENFNGLSDADQSAANVGGEGAELTPPDQGLCSGHEPLLTGHPTVIFEPINEAVAEYATNGTVLSGPIGLASLFDDPFAEGDVRCFYDMQTSTFFFTEIGFSAGGVNTTYDIAVYNSNGLADYQVDSSLGGTCFGDQPKVGFDTHGFYLATDEFCGPGENYEYGELLIAIDKAQLVALDPVLNYVSFGDPTPITIGGVPLLGQQPAFGAPSGTEYLVNSFPFYDENEDPNPTSDLLGFWTVTGDSNIVSHPSKVTLTGKIITSETYANPVPAASTGNGLSTCVPFIVVVNCTSGIEVTSEAFLNPDDDRLQQLQLVNDNQHGLQLYTSLSTALTIGTDPTDRDGAAWFVLNPKTASITGQGFIGVAGAYLMYPAIMHTSGGTTALAFTITSTGLNASAAYVVRKSTSNSFGPVTIVALGAGPHLSFADQLGQVRWGDYSAEVLSPNGADIWSATEYIPPIANQDPIDNWGTRIWEVAG